MSLPTEADFMVIKSGDGATPTEVFTQICGVENVSLAFAANSNDRYRRDCTKLGQPAVRKNRVIGKSLTATGSGAMNIANFDSFEALLGVPNNYEIELRQVDGTAAGTLLGTLAGSFVMVSNTASSDINADSSGEVVLNNEGAWTWTAA